MRPHTHTPCLTETQTHTNTHTLTHPLSLSYTHLNVTFWQNKTLLSHVGDMAFRLFTTKSDTNASVTAFHTEVRLSFCSFA